MSDQGDAQDCQVPVGAFKKWSAYLKQIANDNQTALHHLKANPDLSGAALRNAYVTAEMLRQQMETYIARDPVQHLKDDNAVLENDQDLILFCRTLLGRRNDDKTK